MSKPRRVVFLAFPGTVLLDIAGPWDVLNGANLTADPSCQPYALELVAAANDPHVSTLNGPMLIAARSFAACRGSVDTLVIPGAYGMDGDLIDDVALDRVRRLAGRSRRIVSVCGAASILAAAGLLDGRRVTTHWRDCEQLAREYPELNVEPDRIFVRDGNVYTSAGVTAGMDLALALIEEDVGRSAALAVARNLVMFVRRPGGQTQFSAALEAQSAERDALRDLLDWAGEHLDGDLSVEAMASRANMSARNFSRVFRQEIGRPPGRHVERMRVDAARQELEARDVALGAVAAKCGFGSVNAMRRSFLRVLHVTPSDYRARFRVPGVQEPLSGS
ncbi:MAG: DJ-1/PfpI family protein [Myxococcota bacterium]